MMSENAEATQTTTQNLSNNICGVSVLRKLEDKKKNALKMNEKRRYSLNDDVDSNPADAVIGFRLA
jgi:hypothetical protein